MHATWALNVKMRHENGYERLLKIHHIQNALTLKLNVLLSGREKTFSVEIVGENYSKIMHAKPSTSKQAMKNTLARRWWSEIPFECLMRVKMHLRVIHYVGVSRNLSFRINLTFDEWKALTELRWWSALNVLQRFFVFWVEALYFFMKWSLRISFKSLKSTRAEKSLIFFLKIGF